MRLPPKDLRLTDRWLEWLIRRNEIERVTRFARLLQERSHEFDEAAAGHLFVPIAARDCLCPSGHGSEVVESSGELDRGALDARARGGPRFGRRDLDSIAAKTCREKWARHLNEDDTASTVLAPEATELVRLTRLSLGASSQAFAKLGKFGPTSLREICAEAHRARAIDVKPVKATVHHAPAKSGDRDTGLSSDMIWLCVIVGGVLLVGLFNAAMGITNNSAGGYQTAEGSHTVGDPVALLPENLKPLYAQLRKQGCQVIGKLVAQLPPREHSAARRRLLLAYSQEAGLSTAEKSQTLATAREAA